MLTGNLKITQYIDDMRLSKAHSQKQHCIDQVKIVKLLPEETLRDDGLHITSLHCKYHPYYIIVT